MIEPAHPQMSIARQCDLVGLPRSTYYYQTQGESAENLYLMRLLDKQYTDTPYYGVRRMTAWLRSQGYAVNHKRVARLLRTTNIIERCFVEVRRRTRPMVCFVNVKSVDRILYSISNRFNLEWSQHTFLPFTHAA